MESLVIVIIITGAIGGFIALLVFAPVLTFWFAYIGGMILNWIVGERLVDGLNLMFNTTCFTIDLILLFFSTLSTIGRYFRSTQTNKKEK